MTYCCDALKKQVSYRCADHPDPADCPDSLITEIQDTGEFGIRIHDGGSSFIKIHNCPWCGADLSQPMPTPIERSTATRDEDWSSRVFLLWHVHRHDGYEDEKLIGVYSTEHAASAAQKRAANQPGFRQQPEGFAVASYRLDRDNWPAGFGEG